MPTIQSIVRATTNSTNTLQKTVKKNNEFLIYVMIVVGATVVLLLIPLVSFLVRRHRRNKKRRIIEARRRQLMKKKQLNNGSPINDHEENGVGLSAFYITPKNTVIRPLPRSPIINDLPDSVNHTTTFVEHEKELSFDEFLELKGLVNKGFKMSTNDLTIPPRMPELQVTVPLHGSLPADISRGLLKFVSLLVLPSQATKAGQYSEDVDAMKRDSLSTDVTTIANDSPSSADDSSVSKEPIADHSAVFENIVKNEPSSQTESPPREQNDKSEQNSGDEDSDDAIYENFYFDNEGDSGSDSDSSHIYDDVNDLRLDRISENDDETDTDHIYSNLDEFVSDSDSHIYTNLDELNENSDDDDDIYENVCFVDDETQSNDADKDSSSDSDPYENIDFLDEIVCDAGNVGAPYQSHRSTANVLKEFKREGVQKEVPPPLPGPRDYRRGISRYNRNKNVIQQNNQELARNGSLSGTTRSNSLPRERHSLPRGSNSLTIANNLSSNTENSRPKRSNSLPKARSSLPNGVTSSQPNNAGMKNANSLNSNRVKKSGQRKEGGKSGEGNGTKRQRKISPEQMKRIKAKTAAKTGKRQQNNGKRAAGVRGRVKGTQVVGEIKRLDQLAAENVKQNKEDKSNIVVPKKRLGLEKFV
eukprot:gene5966-6661_t